MAIDLTKMTKFTPNNSVTNSHEYVGEDQIKPFTYSEWLVQVGLGKSTNKDYTTEYNKYVKLWNVARRNRKEKADISEKYKQLLKNIALNYTTTEEKRFLSNIDYNNPRHVTAATVFFSRKIKEISLYYSENRQSIRQSTVKNMSSGSRKSITRYLYSEIPQIMREREITGGMLIGSNDAYADKNVVNIVELYEIDDDTNNRDQIAFDPDIFIDIQQSIKNLLNECLPVLEISQDLSFTISEETAINDENISLLDYENFSSYEKQESLLNLYNLKEYIPKLTGTDIMILSGGNTIELFKAQARHRNILSRELPGVATTKSTKTRTKQQLGNLLVPQNIGVLTYYSHAPIISRLDTNTTGIVPDLTRNGIPGLVEHFEDVMWVKVDAANDGLAGDIINQPNIARFYSYRSDEDYKQNSIVGLSRVDDPVGFFTGEGNEDWSNPDVFPREAANIFQIDERQSTLLVGHEEMTRWSTDVYGNEYALYKKVSPLPPEINESGTTGDEYQTNNTCILIDGGTTLRPRARLWDVGVSYKIFDGGRRWNIDPKVEQRREITPFEDLRQMEWYVTDTGTVEQRLEEHNTWDLQPTMDRTELIYQKITYHGFKKKGLEPVYDEQAWCGLFTDTGCGVIDASQIECVVRDNYAFGTFSDTEDGEYFVSSSHPVTGQQDAFEIYYNSDYESLITFADRPVDEESDLEILINEDIDGNYFSDHGCFDEPAEYVYEQDRLAEYFDVPTNVSQTKLVELNETNEDFADKTSYQQQTDTGRILFRSYNGAKVVDVDQVLAELSTSTGDAIGSERVRFREQIKNHQVIDVNVYFDVIVIQTIEFLYIERLNFDEFNCMLLRSDFPGLLLRTETQDDRVKSFRTYYNKHKHELVCGFTHVTDVEGKPVVYPRIYIVDMNNIATNQIFPNNDYPENEHDYMLNGVLSDFVVEHVDMPIVCYNEIVDMYTLSYTCKLSGGSDVCYGICVSDFESQQLNYRMIDIDLNCTTPVPRANDSRSAWEKKLLSRTIRFKTDDIPIPVNTDILYSYDLTNIVKGDSFKGYQISLTYDTRTLPVEPASAKISRIILDPGDGSPKKYQTRPIYTGFEPLDFDIGAIPDQSDFADPRINQITHDYYFSSTGTYTPTITAVYSNYKKLIINMTLEVEPYTIETGFDDLKLIDSKTFTDPRGNNKQLIVLETQNPRYITHNILSKKRYTNSNVVGYLQGEQYAGPYHTMTDGRKMTGERHTPEAMYLTENP